MPFSVHVDPDELASSDLAAALARPGKSAGRPTVTPDDAATHHGAREAARRRSGQDRTGQDRAGQDRAGRAASAGTGRSYAFRRS